MRRAGPEVARVKKTSIGDAESRTIVHFTEERQSETRLAGG
jgi:hypothetical protein